MSKIGFIGGSGYYNISTLEDVRTREVDTPFGRPSSAYVIGKKNGREFVFLPRHGAHHTLSPSQINYRANIYGFKSLGVSRIFSFSAVGSMKKENKVEDILVPDQFIDWTKSRAATFFDEGVVAHVSMAEPTCPEMHAFIASLLKDLGYAHKMGGTYINIEGPQFSSKGESFLYKSWGVDVIGMTNATEAKLCREAELCYISLNFVTDYDCWHEEEEHVSTTQILEVLKRNVSKAKAITNRIMDTFHPAGNCDCDQALSCAIVTQPKGIHAFAKKKYDLLIGKYVK